MTDRVTHFLSMSILFAQYSNRPKDVELVAKFFEMIGLDVDSLCPEPVPPDDSIRLLRMRSLVTVSP